MNTNEQKKTTEKEENWRITIIKELLQTAKTDLESSSVLYERLLYQQSIFLFQQSVEKAIKVFALTLNPAITENDLKKRIGHDSITVYEELTKLQMNSYGSCKELFDKFPSLKGISIYKDFDIEKDKKQLELYLSEIKEVKTQKRKLIEISIEEIQNYITMIAELKKEINNFKSTLMNNPIPENIQDAAKNEALKAIDCISKDDPNAIAAKNFFNNVDMKKLLEGAFKYIYFPLFDIMITYLSLYYLAVVTLPHAVLSRYPQDGFTPSKLYTKDLPIVEMLPELIEIQKDAIAGLNEMISYEINQSGVQND